MRSPARLATTWSRCSRIATSAGRGRASARGSTTTANGCAPAGANVGADEGEFLRWFELAGLQRHLKVLGIFSRLWYRDGKREYLADLPLTLRYVRDTAARYAELRRFSAWVEAALVPGLEAANARAHASVPA